MFFFSIPWHKSYFVGCHALKLCSAEVVIAWKWGCYQCNIQSMGYYVYVLLLSTCWLWRISLILQPIRNSKIFWMNNNANIIQSKFFFLFIGREPTTWPANNCLQIMVCSCAMPSNCAWLQIICSCIKETVPFSFLWSLLRENGRLLRFPKILIEKQTWWSTDKTIIELGYRKISWFVSVSQVCSPQTNHDILLNLVQ